MNELPPALQPGEKITNTWIGHLLRAIRRQRPLAGPGVSARITPDGTVLSVAAPTHATPQPLAPFAVRFHVTEDDTDGKWEIYLPPGCVAVGGDCDPLNLAASEVSGHEDDGDNWYLLHVDETEPTAQTRSEKDSSGQTVTVTFRRWHVKVHAKTSAKVVGVDALDAPARRMFFAAAEPDIVWGQGHPTDEERVRYQWGDDFAKLVNEIWLEQWPASGEESAPAPVRRTVPRQTMPISVQSRTASNFTASNFDLVWYFSTDEDDGELAVEHVYCTRATVAAAGLQLVGPTMTEVTDAEEYIYAKILTNPLQPANMANTVEVVLDPVIRNNPEEYLTWLPLYHMTHNAVVDDMRLQSLTNIQVYR